MNQYINSTYVTSWDYEFMIINEANESTVMNQWMKCEFVIIIFGIELHSFLSLIDSTKFEKLKKNKGLKNKLVQLFKKKHR